MDNTVYVVMLEWATTDDAGVDYYLYKNYNGALKKFIDLMEDELNPDISWVADAFDENGEVKDGFELDCNTDNKHSGDCDLYWRISATYDYRYSYITLTKKEIIGD